MRLSAVLLAVTPPILALAGACSGAGGGEGSGQAFGGAGGSGAGAGAGGSSASSGSGGTFSGGNGGSLPSDGSGGSGGLQDGQICNEQDYTGTLVPASILFVVDRSGSMNCFPGEPDAVCNLQPKAGSKWSLTLAALQQAVDRLAGTSSVSAGVSMFPVRGTSCQVSDTPNVFVAPLTQSHTTGLKAFLGTVDPGGNTPIAGATILGYDYLHRRHVTDGNKFLVLLTDGAETCKQSELTKLVTQDVPNARLVNIRTFAIGVPGSEEARQLLSEMAFQGGTARSPTCVHDPASAPTVGDCHFDMTTTTDFATDLSNALAAVSGSVLTCEFDVPQTAEFDPGKVNVRLNGVDIPPDPNDPCGSGAQGWQYVDATHTKIRLCGPPCDAAKLPGASVKIVLGCPTIPPQ